jgi:hypothetical protein
VVDLHVPLGQQLLDVAERQGEAQVPAHRQHDDVGWEAVAAKADRCAGAGQSR